LAIGIRRLLFIAVALCDNRAKKNLFAWQKTRVRQAKE